MAQGSRSGLGLGLRLGLGLGLELGLGPGLGLGLGLRLGLGLGLRLGLGGQGYDLLHQVAVAALVEDGLCRHRATLHAPHRDLEPLTLVL